VTPVFSGIAADPQRLGFIFMAEDNELEIGIKKLRKRKRLPIYLTLILILVMFILNFVEKMNLQLSLRIFFLPSC
jgi:hypothetical protein